jgi:hypothetical protein
MPDSSSYLRRFFTRASRETALFTYRKLLVGLVMGLIGRFALLLFAKIQITWADVWRDLLIFSGSYVVVVLASLLWNLFRTPVLLDKERGDEITVLTAKTTSYESERSQLELSKQRLEVQKLTEEMAARSQQSKIEQLSKQIQTFAAEQRVKQQANSPSAVLSEDEICQALSALKNDAFSALLILRDKGLAKQLDAHVGLWAVR